MNDCINGSGANTCSLVGGGTGTHSVVSGDTVQVASGSCVITAQITLPNVCFVLTGNGTTNNSTSSIVPGTINTTLIDAINNGSSPIFNEAGLSQSNCPGGTAAQIFRISLISFVPCTGSGTPTATNGSCTAAMTNGYSPISIYGTCTSSGCPSVRFDNLSFTNWNTSTNGSQSNSKIRESSLYAVMDHNDFDIASGGGGQEAINCEMSSYLGVGSFGDNSWHQPSPWGSLAQLYVENNTFNHSNLETEFPAKNDPGTWGGCRMVIRFNSFNGNVVNSSPYITYHGTDTSGRGRIGAQVEAYGNIFACTGSECNGSASAIMYSERDGDIIAFLNTLTTGGVGQIHGMFLIQEQRTWRTTALGVCDGSGPFDNDDGFALVGSPIALTNVSGTTLTVAGTPWTATAFNFPGANLFMVYDETNGSIGFVSTNTPNTLVYSSLSNPSVAPGGGSFAIGHNIQLYSVTLYASGTNTATSGTTDPTLSNSYSPSQWVSLGTPYSLVNITQGYGADIGSNSGTAIGYAVVGGIQNGPTQNGGTGWTWNLGDFYAILRATQCLDQPNRSQEQAITLPTVSANVMTPFTPSAILFPFYEAADTLPAGLTFGVGQVINYNPSRFLANRDYYLETVNQTAQTNATSPFSGATGTGHGTLAFRPTTCTAGVAYLATDQGTWNTSGGANLISYSGQGRWYNCTATNTWGTLYTPAVYPNPLIALSLPATTSPTNLSIFVVH